MEENVNPTQSEQQRKGCTGDCKLCTMFQRGYCASQIAYNNMGLLGEVFKNLAEMRKDFATLASKVEGEQLSNGELFAPTTQENAPQGE